MEWWDHITWDTLLEHTAATMVQVPRALTYMAAQWRARVSRFIKSQPTVEGQRRGWKLFLALDLFLYGDLRDDLGQHSKTKIISDRMEAMNTGQWGSV